MWNEDAFILGLREGGGQGSRLRAGDVGWARRLYDGREMHFDVADEGDGELSVAFRDAEECRAVGAHWRSVSHRGCIRFVKYRESLEGFRIIK